MFIKLGSFWRQSQNWLVKAGLEGFVFNRKVRRIYKGIWARKQLKPYLQIAQEFQPVNRVPTNDQTIWQYWDGEMPNLVRGCLASVALHHPNRQLLNFSSLEQYVNLPGFYFDYLKKGKIKPASFSDVVRAYLLREHGGIWLDATIYLTAPLPAWLTNAPLFWFQTREKEDLDGLSVASYCLASVAHHPLFEMLIRSFDEYWRNNLFTLNYFWFLHLLTLLTQTKIGQQYVATIPFYSFMPVERLQWELLKPYSAERWQQIQQMSPLHKLSYKPQVLGWNKTKSLKGTFCEFLFGSGAF